MKEGGVGEKEESTEKTSGKFRVKLYLIYVKKTNADMKKSLLNQKDAV